MTAAFVGLLAVYLLSFPFFARNMAGIKSVSGSFRATSENEGPRSASRPSPPFVVYFSRNIGLNRALYVVYCPIIYPCAKLGNWQFLDDASALSSDDPTLLGRALGW